jgi:hypothetical protein
VCLSGKACSLLDLGVNWCVYREKQPVGSLHGDFDLFLLPMFFQGILDLVVSDDEWILRSSKPCMAREFVTSVVCLMHCDG